MNVEEYVETLFVQDAVMRKDIVDELQKMDVSANLVSSIVAKTLYMLVKISGAKRVLEIGSLAGYSSLWLARGLQHSDGTITSIEIRSSLVELAKSNAQKANLEKRIQYVTGEAMQTLDYLKKYNVQFDLFFIDADKVNYPQYLDKILELSAPGAVILADNVLWGKRILDSGDRSKNTEAIRLFNQKVAAHNELESILLPIGDGLMVAKLKE